MVPKLLGSAPSGFKRYIEPFCGSACLFLAIRPSAAILADLNPHVIATYRAIQQDPIGVARALKAWSPTREDYLKARALTPKNQVQAASRFLFLNRYSFNGVYRENRSGQFNVPFGGARNGQLPSLPELQTFAVSLSSAELICADFEQVICQAGEGDFLYLDPPYHYGNTRNRGEYGCGAFGSVDLNRFVDAVRSAAERGAKVLISYNKAHALQQRLVGWRLGYETVRRSVAGFTQSRENVREYLLRNY
jgi:DNA adenine methylase